MAPQGAFLFDQARQRERPRHARYMHCKGPEVGPREWNPRSGTAHLYGSCSWASKAMEPHGTKTIAKWELCIILLLEKHWHWKELGLYIVLRVAYMILANC